MLPLSSRFSSLPPATGLYRTQDEHDACGVAMVATTRGFPGHDILERAITALENLDHRGAMGAEENTGDGAGILTQLPDRLLREVMAADGVMLPEPGTEKSLPAQLVLLAMGFTGPRTTGALEQLGIALDKRGNIQHDRSWSTNVPGVFTAGDCARGQSLIVWAIAEGRSCAAAVDAHLMGSTTLPGPVNAHAKPITL